MAIILDKDNDVVTYENQPEQAREMFPNIDDGQNAAAAAESARQAADAAETAVASVAASIVQIETNKNDIAELKEQIPMDINSALTGIREYSSMSDSLKLGYYIPTKDTGGTIDLTDIRADTASQRKLSYALF